MKKSQNPKIQPYYVPTSIQRVFTYTIISLYLALNAFIAFNVLAQYQEGSDFRPQLSYLITSNVVPIVMFLLAYLLNPRKLNRLSKAFESLLIVIAGVIGWELIAMVFPGMLQYAYYQGDYTLYDYASNALVLVIYTGLLILLRKKGTWS